MKQKKSFRQIFSVFLVFAVLFGALVPTLTVFAEGNEVQYEIESFTITDPEGNVHSEGYMVNHLFRLNYKWHIKSELHEGDYFELELPKEFDFNRGVEYNKVDVHAPDEETVVAEGEIMPDTPGGGKIKVTFLDTEYIKNKSDVYGMRNLIARWNQAEYPVEQEKEYTVNSGGKDCKITLKPYIDKYKDEVIYKTAGQSLENQLVRWRIRVNAKQDNLTNVVITDTLKVAAPGSTDDIQYVDDKFVLVDLVLENGKFVEKNPRNISGDIKLSENKRSFTYNMGKIDGKAYMLHYRSTYKQGLTLENKVELDSEEVTGKKSYGIFHDSQSQGSIDDLKSRIKITKVDAHNKTTTLEGAEFEIKRNPGVGGTPIFVESVTTDKKGEAVTKKLEPGEYTIKETKAPEKYVKDEMEYTVTVGADKIVEKTISNKPGREIKAEKKWVDNNNEGNTRPEFITLILSENGKPLQNPEVYPDDNDKDKWTYTFEDLPKYDDKGKEINYTVKEVDEDGKPIEDNGNITLGGNKYTVTYGGSMEKGFVITNTKGSNPPTPGGGGQSGGGSGGTGGGGSDKPKPNDPKPNNPTPNEPTPSDGQTPPDGSVVPNDSTTSTSTVEPKNHKMQKDSKIKKTVQVGRRLPKTGEGANPTLYAWMLGALGSMLVLLGYRKRKTVK